MGQLTMDYNGMHKFCNITVEDLTPQQKFKIFKSLLKSEPSSLKFGGGFHSKCTGAMSRAPVHILELKALLATVNYFSEFIKLNNTVLLSDSRACVMGLQSLKSTDYKRFLKYSLILNDLIPNAQLCFLPGTNNQMADSFSRILRTGIVKDVNNIDEIQMIPLKELQFKFTKELSKPKTVSKISNKLNFRQFFNFENIPIFDKLLSVDNLNKFTTTEHSQLIHDQQLVQKGLIFVHSDPDGFCKPFIPNKLVNPMILHCHYMLGHKGVKYLYDHLNDL